ncbi:FAD-dependent oxidoreductase [Acidisphaera sp. L21]|uniref:FAD-dependent oxidoreductase n=1 Tax=Acidisphaera sp. L21 TaxID=1641851 RepID=UPI00131DBCB5|nr:FAD-dependent oxidoreductase [Acidisphaera sp. L21]
MPMVEVSAIQLDALAQGLTGLEVGDTKLLFVREGNDVRAFQGTCPHAKAPLADGVLCEGRIICPWHAGAFDSKTGALLEPVPLTGLQRHAVRVIDGRVLVDIEPMHTDALAPGDALAHAPDDRVFVLVGTGAASASAAALLRDDGFGGRVILVGPDAAEPLDRTQLSKMALAQDAFDRSTLPLLDDELQKKLKLERIVARVTAVDPGKRQLTLSTGETLAYDAAMLATGAQPLALSIEGGDLPHVRTLRSLSDVDGILAHVEPGASAVIIGTSFIGMEVASDLIDRKMNVTVIGRDEIPFAKQFGPRVGAALRTLHESKGVRFRLGTSVQRITLDAVIVNDESLSAGLVVAGLGVAPVLDYVPSLQKADDGGLVTDTALRVADGLWAAGDIASPSGWPRIEHWRLAQQHGRVAAAAMLGRDACYEGVPFFWTAQHGKRLQYIGHGRGDGDIAYDGDVEAFDFVAWYLEGGKVTAALVCCRDRIAATLSHALRRTRTLAEARAMVGLSAGGQ